MTLVKSPREIAKLLKQTLLKQTLDEWLDDRGFTRAASLSYCTVFSIAPLLLVAVAIAGFVFGRDAVSGQLQQELEALVGPSGASTVQDMMKSAATHGGGVLATVVGSGSRSSWSAQPARSSSCKTRSMTCGASTRTSRAASWVSSARASYRWRWCSSSRSCSSCRW